jgi:hypothetical protein
VLRFYVYIASNASKVYKFLLGSINASGVPKMTFEAKITIFPDGRLDTKSAAAYLGLSTKTLAMYRCNGEGPKYVKRGRIYYFRQDLDEWVDAGRVQSTAQAKVNLKG